MPIGYYKNGIPIQLGKKCSEETRLKMSKSHLERKKRLGYINSPETRRKLSIAGMGHSVSEGVRRRVGEAQSGERNWGWKGGISKNKKYMSWLKNKRNRLKGYIGELLGSHTFGEWELLKKQYRYTCPACERKEPEIKLTEDHIIPLSKGGSDNIENIQPLCQSCNAKKHTKIIRYGQGI